MNEPTLTAGAAAPAPARRCYGCARRVGERHEIECAFAEPGDVVAAYDCLMEVDR